VGVTDLPELLKNDRFGWGSPDAFAVFEELAIGDPKLQEDKLKQTSPIYRTADIHVPVLAAWGKNDQRVPIEQGRSFRDAAKRAGVELEYVEYADEGHNWLKPETSIDFFSRVEKLLARTIGQK
jgi:dipeptidyl aminopeptidase/acylaminoacyl peptidase